jgi:hypothetical protein
MKSILEIRVETGRQKEALWRWTFPQARIGRRPSRARANSC